METVFARYFRDARLADFPHVHVFRGTYKFCDSPEHVGDQGFMVRLLRYVGATDANIEEVHHQRKFTQLPVKSAAVEFVLHTRNHAHGTEIVAALTAAGFAARLQDG